MFKIIAIILAIYFYSVVECAPSKEVTNEEIRDAILSLVHSYNLLDNKLERHEHRERALGELVKRALQTLQKGQKAFEPMNGIFSRLDERVSQIETMLMTQEDKYNTQSDKLVEALESIFKWMKENGDGFAKHPTTQNDNNNQELISQIKNLSQKVGDLLQQSQKLLQQSEKLIETKLATADEVISKLEDKLSHFYITGPATPSPADVLKNAEYEKKVSQHLDEISNTLQNMPRLENKLSDSDKIFLEKLSNKTIMDVGTESNKAISSSILKIVEDRNKIENTMYAVQNEILTSNKNSEKFFDDVNKSVSALEDGLNVFNKFDKILLATSDYVLDTQRKVEFGTHQVLQKVGQLIKEQNTDLNKTIQQRFNDIDSSIVNNHLEALQNLSSTMESEISHVWRQIEIMHSEIAYSKEALNKLQGKTETYVNGTLSTMDSMEGKVGQITSRMTEVDDNLNFLLGRLSLVTQEFNRIKSGLGSALDEIRNSFQTVQNKIKQGPGPHNIRNDYDTETNLLQREGP